MADGGDPVEAFRAGSAALLSSLLVLRLPDDKSEQDVAVRHLSDVERGLIRELNVMRIRSVVKEAEAKDNEDPREVLKRDLLGDIARLRKSLDSIGAQLTSSSGSKQAKSDG